MSMHQHTYVLPSFIPSRCILIEEWRTVHYGYYEVSNLGQLRRTNTQRILNGSLTPKGYLRANLSIDGEIQGRFFHGLVAEAWIGPCPSGLEVNHRDGNKLNNAVDNLEYVTHAENVRHATEDVRLIKSVLNENQVREIYQRFVDGETQTSLGEEFGVSNSCISNITRGKEWKHLNLSPIKSSMIKRSSKKLTEEQVRGIHALSSEGLSHRRIAREIGIPRGTVYSILNGTRWTHIYNEVHHLA